MTWDRSLAGQKCDGSHGCGHALSRHNSLGYCRHYSKRDGYCICGSPSHMRPQTTATDALMELAH